MPIIPPTRSKKLKKASQDPVQWKLTHLHEKATVGYSLNNNTREYAKTTVAIAKKFTSLSCNQYQVSKNTTFIAKTR